jgi:uncharacterized coiled-coil protein SlyX
MTHDGLRLDLADARVRIMTLERVVAHQGETIARLADLIERLAMPTVERAAAVAEKHCLIRALARFLAAGSGEVTARQIERIYAREIEPPRGAESVVEALRRVYPGGPSRSTILRALSKIPSTDGSATSAASCANLNIG